MSGTPRSRLRRSPSNTIPPPAGACRGPARSASARARRSRCRPAARARRSAPMITKVGPVNEGELPRAGGEQGSALIIATLVTVILALLGLSYLMMAQTESTIAENERNAATAMYVAEAGTRLVVNWFNDPTATGYLVPTSAQVDQTLRVFDHDANPGTARVQAVAGDWTRALYQH